MEESLALSSSTRAANIAAHLSPHLPDVNGTWYEKC